MTDYKVVALVLQGVISAAVLIVVLYVAARLVKAFRDHGVKAKYVKLAITILSEVPDAERQDREQRALREWAAQLLNAHSEIELAESAQHALVERMPLVEPAIAFHIRVEDQSGVAVSGAHVQLAEHIEGYRTIKAAGRTDRFGVVAFGYMRGFWVPHIVSVKAEGFLDFLSEVAPLSRHHGRVIVLQPKVQE